MHTQTRPTTVSRLNRITTYLDPGLVVVVAPASFLQGWLQPEIDDAQDRDPSLLPVLCTDETARFIDEVDVDIHISERPLQQPNLLECPLFQDKWIVVGAPAFVQQNHSREFDKFRLLCLEKSLADDTKDLRLQEQLNQCQKTAFYDDQRLLISALKNQRGIACVLYSSIAHDLKQGHLQRLHEFESSPGPTWTIARMAGQTRSPKVRQLFDEICQAAQALPAIDF